MNVISIFIIFTINRISNHRNIHSFPTRRSSDLLERIAPAAIERVVIAPPALIRRQPTLERRLRQDPQEPAADDDPTIQHRSEEHTSELQSRRDLVCRLLLEKKNNKCLSRILVPC